METFNNTANPILSEIEKELGEYTEKPIINPEVQPKSKRGRKPKAEKQPEIEQTPLIEENPIISGSLLILMIDLIIPNLIAFANNKFTKKKIKASKLQMTAKQREDLIPIADQVAKEMAVKANPMTVLLISLLGIYGVNFMSLKTDE